MAERTTRNLPTLAATPVDGETRYVECKTTVLIGGMYTEVTAGVLARADVELQPRIATVDGAVALELVDPAGEVVSRTVHSVPAPVEPEPWPRTVAVPPQVWTELPGGAGTVLNEGDATVTVTVGEDGAIQFGGPMRWLPADTRDEYDGWGEDA